LTAVNSEPELQGLIAPPAQTQPHLPPRSAKVTGGNMTPPIKLDPGQAAAID
jgi:hypothetical protein